jgi:ubiquinone/menaquinone biosynthesis C-methylase UbiE
MNLPFRNNAFDAALAILTIHHWPDQMRGLSEMHRVAKRNVAFT